MSTSDRLWIVVGLVLFLCLAPTVAARSEPAPPDRTITVATFNRGDHTRYRAVRRVARRADLAALQEMHDQERTLRRLDRTRRFEVITCAGASRYARATPVVYQPARVRLLRTVCRLLLPRRWLGPGVGPDRNMPKWLVGGFFEHRATGGRLWFGSVHNVPHGAGSELRDRAALDFTRRLATIASDWRRTTVIGGDWNAGWRAPSVEPIRQSFAQLGGQPTHGPSAIDWFARALSGAWRVLGTWTRNVRGSDHRVLFAQLQEAAP